MKNIRFKFIGLGYDNRCQACIQIFDKCNNLIEEGMTYNGCFEACLECNNIYRVKATFCTEIIDQYIYTSRDFYTFLFPHAYREVNNNTNPITLLLTDYFYGLKIEKGEINLWPKP